MRPREIVNLQNGGIDQWHNQEVPNRGDHWLEQPPSTHHTGAVDLKLLDALFTKMEGDQGTSMPTFDGVGRLNGVKILICKDR